MVTKEQAVELISNVYGPVFKYNHFHYGTCTKYVGARGGIKYGCTRVRRNGQTKTWQTRPDEFKIPVKYGLKRYGYIDHNNAKDFHVASECPVEELR